MNKKIICLTVINSLRKKIGIGNEEGTNLNDSFKIEEKSHIDLEKSIPGREHSTATTLGQEQQGAL